MSDGGWRLWHQLTMLITRFCVILNRFRATKTSWSLC